MILQKGTLLTPKLRLVAPLGAGGMAAVWTAEHLGLGTRVAVKFVAGSATGDPTTAHARFEREAAITARIESAHVIRVFDCGKARDGTPFLVMELLRGETLGQRIARRGRLDLPATATLVAQLGAALAAALAERIVHRDITPANVFLVDSEYELFVKLLDFGVAKDADSVQPLTASGGMLGTPHYMSPEQLLGAADVDARADLWALGAVAYHALTGRRAFEGATLAALGVAVNDGDFPAPSALVPDVPASVDAWFGRALCVAVERRFASAEELGSAFFAAAGLRTDVTSLRRRGRVVPPARDLDQVSAAGSLPAVTEDAGGAAPPPEPGSTLSASVGVAPDRPRAVLRRRWLFGVAVGVVLAVSAAGLFAAGRAASVMAAPSGSGGMHEAQVGQPTEPPRAAGVPIGTPTNNAGSQLPPAPRREAAVAASVVATAVRGASHPTRGAARSWPAAFWLSPPSRSATVPAVVPTASPTSAAAVRPSYCDGDDGFTVDAQGHYHPKAECL